MMRKSNTEYTPLDISNITRSRLDEFCIDILALTTSLMPSGNTLFCRKSVPEDYRYRLLCTVKLDRNGKVGTYEVYQQSHYFFNDTIVFKKVSTGGIGYLPFKGHTYNTSTKVVKWI